MLKVVVIEDEHFIRTGLCEMIEELSADYTVMGSASNGHDGLILLKQYQPDLAICDIKMGRYDGLDMIANVRELGLPIRFVILSGYSEFSYAQTAIRLGVEDYLLKPVMLDQLQDILRRVHAELNHGEAGQEAAGQYASLSMLAHSAKQSIDSEYHEKLTLNGLSDNLGVTPEYLGSVITKELGMSFSTYLRKVRMEKAKALLSGTDKKIYEIAALVGYDDAQYFCRVFKEETGMTPKRFIRSKEE